MRLIRVTTREAGIQKLLGSKPIAANVERRAVRVATAGKASAPVLTGRYRGSLRVVPHPTKPGAFRVISTVPYARKVQARTGNLSRALRAAGGRE